MTPFDDPQAELAWMFLQNLTAEGDLDEAFTLLADDFSYWNNSTRHSYDQAGLRRIVDWLADRIDLEFHLLRCLNEGQSVVIEAQSDGVTRAGVRYDSPIAFIFDTRDGLITSMREYGDTRLVEKAFGITRTE